MPETIKGSSMSCFSPVDFFSRKILPQGSPPRGIMARLEAQSARRNHIAQLKAQLVLAFEEARESEEKGHYWAADQYRLDAAGIAQALLDEGAIR